MKQQLSLFVFAALLAALPAVAQVKANACLDRLNGAVHPDRTELACTGDSLSLYRLMEQARQQRKIVMVVFDGIDCGNCKRNAPNVSRFMERHADKFVFWAPLGKLNGKPACTDIETWDKQYPGYRNATSFLIQGTHPWYMYGDYNWPYYTVIDPATRKIHCQAGQNDFEKGSEQTWAYVSGKALQLHKATYRNTKKP